MAMRTRKLSRTQSSDVHPTAHKPRRRRGVPALEALERRTLLAGEGTGLLGTYYDNVDFTGPTVTRVDSTVAFDWLSDSPAVGIGPDTFSVVWEGQVEATTGGFYQFSSFVDDGIRIWVNGQLQVDEWRDGPPRQTFPFAGVDLSAGEKADIRVEYYENGGGATAHLLWITPDGVQETVPQSQLYPAAAHQPQTPPAAPTDLSGFSFHPSQVQLFWSDNAQNEFGYSVERSTEGESGPFTVVGTASAAFGSFFVDDTAWAGQTFYYRVRAFNSAGVSDPSNVFAVTTESSGGVVGAGQGLSATYYHNVNFTDPVLSRVDPVVVFNYGPGSPDPAIAPDTFSAVWEGKVQAQFTEDYTFHTFSDDGVRLWIDGQLVIDDARFFQFPRDNYSSPVPLVAGEFYDIRLEYFEDFGPAQVRLEWFSGSTQQQTIPRSQLYHDMPPTPRLPAAPGSFTAQPFGAHSVELVWSDRAYNETGYELQRRADGEAEFSDLATLPPGATAFTDTSVAPSTGYTYRLRALGDLGPSDWVEAFTSTGESGGLVGTGTGLRAVYYNNRDLTDPAVTRVDPTVNFHGQDGMLTPDPAIDSGTYSAVWLGQVQAQFTEDYIFHSLSDDGVRLWIDGQLVIDNWTDHPPTFNDSFPIPLVEGELYDIRLEWFQGVGGATIELLWSSLSTPQRIIPASQLYPADEPLPPRIAGVPAQSGEGAAIALTASPGQPGDFTFSWTVAKEGQPYAAGDGDTFTFTPDDDGLFTVTLTATDGAGTAVSATADINVSDVAPTLTFSGATSADEGAPYVLNLSSADPGADTIAFWTIDWGDGTIEQVAGNPSSATHVYADDGAYTITATATDEDGTWQANLVSTYALTDWYSDWYSAHFDAMSRGANLVAINDAAEQARIEELFINGQAPEAFWIGLTDSEEFGASEGNFVWTSGEPLTFTNWNTPTSEPNNQGDEDFTLINFQTWFGQPGFPGSWNDSSPFFSWFRGIIEFKSAAPVTVTVNNVAPAAAISGPATAVRGQQIDLAASMTDAAGDSHAIAWDFGDGTTAAGGFTQSHLYTAAGSYTVTLTVTDDDGATTTTTHLIEVKAVDVQGDTLFVGGTLGDDAINVTTDGAGAYLVNIGGLPAGSAAGVNRIVVFGQDGNDSIVIGGGVQVTAELFGGAGNDSLHGGGAGDLLLGGDGDDHLIGGNARDVLIGGDGRDRLIGNAGEDILLGGSLTQSGQALTDIAREWRRPDLSFGDRQINLNALFNSSTVIDDGDADQLIGGGDTQNWLIAG